MDSMDRFNETTLPNIEKIYSDLQLKHISEDDYKHANKVWDVFETKTLGDYHDLYVQADTAQLSDVFESFRSLCLKEYQLDPAYFVSTPSLANEAMLKITKAKTELLTDINMVLMIEKGIHGGLTQVIKKMVLLTISIYLVMIALKKVYIYSIWTQITYMDGLCAKTCHLTVINGLMLKNLIVIS